MNLITKLKYLTGSFFLEKEYKQAKRAKTVFNLSDAKSIGIIYDATDIHDFETVRFFVKTLKEEKKAVKALGFVDSKEIKDFQQPKLEFDFFVRKDLNWYYKPMGHLVHNFIEEEYDILIDLTMKNLLPLQHVAAMSRAKFKVGKYDERHKSFYDLMIDINKDSNLKFFITQVKHYLTIINTGIKV